MLFRGHRLKANEVDQNEHALRPFLHEIDNPHHSVFALLGHVPPLLEDALAEAATEVTLRQRCQILGKLQLLVLLYH